MFIDQFGIGNIMMPIQRYQPFQPNMPQQQGRMLSGSAPQTAGLSSPAMPPSTPPPTATTPGTPPSMPPGWSTPPFNPAGTPPPTNPPPTTVSGPVTPGAMPQTPAEPVEPVTVDEEGNVVTAEPTDFGPGVFKLKEGATRFDRMKAGAMMLSAAGTPRFANISQTVNAGLNQKDLEAEQYNQALLQMTRPRYEEGEDKNGNYIRKTYKPAYEYDPVAGVVRAIPQADRQGPEIEMWTSEGWKRYDPGNNNANRKMYTDQRGLNRWQDTNELVNPGEEARLNRSVARGGQTPKDVQAIFKDQTQQLTDMKQQYNNLQRTLYDTENPFSDVSTLFSFMKTADPGSVVRPSEADMFSGAGSVGTMVANYLNKMAAGQTLTNMQQAQLAQTVDQLMIGQIEDVETHRRNWEEYFALPDQVADGWSTDSLNPVDPLYGNTLAEDIRARLASGKYTVGGTSLTSGGNNTSVTTTDEDEAAVAAALAEQREEEERIRRGVNAGMRPRNPRIPGVN